MGRWKDTRTISRDIMTTKGSPQSHFRGSSAAHHAPCSPLRSPRTMKSREHKLDICFDFTRGTCRRGDGCRFSHNLPPGGVIPPRPKTAGVCFDYTKGICNRGYVSRCSRHPGEISRRISRFPSRRLKSRHGGSQKARFRAFRWTTDDAFSRRASRRSGVLVPPSSVNHHLPPVGADPIRHAPQRRVPLLARRAGGRGVRETRGERRAASEGAAEAASGPGGAAGGGRGLARRSPANGHALQTDALARDGDTRRGASCASKRRIDARDEPRSRREEPRRDRPREPVGLRRDAFDPVRETD